MPTFSSEALQAFRDAFAATSAGFFGFFRRLLDFILSSPVLFFSVALPIAGLVFLMIFCLLRGFGDRGMDASSMGATLYSRNLDGAFTSSALITRNAFRRAKKMHHGKGKGKGAMASAKVAKSADVSSGDDLYAQFGVTRQQMRKYHTRPEPHKSSISVGGRTVPLSKLDIDVDD